MRSTAIGHGLATLAILLFASTSPAKDKKKVSNLFDAPPPQVFDSVYRYAQHNGTIKLVDERRFTLSGVIIVPGGGFDMQKQFDCTISVEPTGDGTKSLVNVIGTFPAKQQSLIGSMGEGPAVKVLKAIRDEFDRDATPEQKPGGTVAPKYDSGTGTKASQPSGATTPELATVTVKSAPDECEITVDGKYVGGTPATVRLAPGDRTISVTKSGFKTWQRTVTLTPGGTVTLNATLDKE